MAGAPPTTANNFLDLHADAKRVISAAVVRSVQAVFDVDFSANEHKLKALDSSFAAGGKNGDLCLQFHRFSKDFKTKPVVVSQKIAEHFTSVLESKEADEVKKIVKKVDATGPYVNFFFRMGYLSRVVHAANSTEDSFFAKRPAAGDKDRVMIEYSQPNSHKAFHVGHMRNVAIGDSLVRLYEQLGHEVVAVNYYGDEGAHVAKCLWLLSITCTPEELEAVPVRERGEFLGAFYTKSVELLDLGSLTCMPVKGVVSAKVVKKAPHPQNPAWNVVDVELAESKTCQVVCAGTDYGVGDVVAYTPVGGTLKGNPVIQKDMKGVTSSGVIMGVSELAGVPPSSPSCVAPEPPAASPSPAEAKADDSAPVATSKKQKQKGSKKGGGSGKKKDKKKPDKKIYILPPSSPVGQPLTEIGRMTKEVYAIIDFIRASPDAEFSWADLTKDRSLSEVTKAFLKPVLAKSTYVNVLKDSVQAHAKLPAHEEILAKYASHYRKPLADSYSEQPVEEIIDGRMLASRDVLKLLEAEKVNPTQDLWRKTRQWSLDEFKRIYKWIGARFDHDFFESEVSESSLKMAQEYYDKGVLVKDNGAVGADLSNVKPHSLGFCILLKSNGSGLYATKDLALALKKFDQYKIDRSIYVVDDSQTLHFKQVFAVLKRMGYKQAEKCSHLRYALVTTPKGKMSSRAGTVIVFSELVRLLDQYLRKSCFSKSKHTWEDEELEEALRAVSAGTIRYGMLNQDVAGEIVFDLKKWTDPRGNTGSYLMYQYTRIVSILRETDEPQDVEADFELLTTKDDRYMLSQMAHFWEVVDKCVNARAKDGELKGNPMPLCQYLYDLCQTFSSWYANPENNVKNTPSAQLRKTRLEEIKALKTCIQTGLGLLGINVLEKM